ncbi:GTP cyclohydrolase [Aquabacterium sp. NJ1]|uniref:YciI family protein n=1 Tax=Aquabacterium sp. NJ1 TaxID=1538295 RepID=UPI00052DFEF5|nr:YciI family protein [Aquabacterium sp. NJ1]KGM41388.1 GTP cyclohydrolase [Aquabacterium sp. NJ1]
MLFLILLDYQRPLSEVDAHIEAHRAFLTRHYEAGHFVMSGRKSPRTGGVILAKASALHEVARWIADDPFCQARVASYQVVAWEPTMVAADLSPEAIAADALRMVASPA